MNPARAAPRRWLLPVNLLLIGLISFLDWLTAAGVVVGILLVLPILASAVSDRSRDVWVTFAAATAGFLLAAWSGAGPLSPERVWVPNRVLAALSLPGSLVIALFLQSLRLRSELALAEAERSSDLNRLLLSLLAHDLRAPLGMAIQTFELLDSEPHVVSESRSLAQDVRIRLRRSLRSIDSILAVARDSPEGSETVTVSGTEILAEIRSDVTAFEAEARARGKTLQVELECHRDRAFALDLRIPRQAVSILVDNAIRHSLPGEIRVLGTVADGRLDVRVRDPGPPLADGPSQGSPRGMGLGLALCRTLAHRASGSVEVEALENGGKALVLRLPLKERKA